MTPAATPEALVARISELEAENAQLTVERNEAQAMRRWNIDRTDDGEVLVCRGHHDKGEDCDHERFVPEADLQRVTAERDADRVELARLTFTDEAGTVWKPVPGWQSYTLNRKISTAEATLATATAEAASLRAEIDARQAADDALLLSNDGELEADPQKQIAHLQLSCREFIREREEWKASAKREWAEVDRLRAEVEALKGALKPFADVCDAEHMRHIRDEQVLELSTRSEVTVSEKLRGAHFRAARTALARAATAGEG